MDKAALRRELIASLEAALATARAAHAAAVEGSTHEEARPENDKDTRGLEQSYLARGQARRIAELEAAVAETTALALRPFTDATPVAMSALVTVEDNDLEQRYFIAAHGGGALLAGGVQVVTPASPIGRALIGRRVGDEVELRLPAKLHVLVITDVA
jgi:transcription elongation GreA/GreB family factor